MSNERRTRKLLRRIPRAELEAAAKLIREAIEDEHLVKLRSDIDADPKGWSAMYHFGGGRDVRNLLRFCGFTEKWSSVPDPLSSIDVVLDQVWAPLVELAMQGYNPPPGTRRRVVRQTADQRWRTRRRAYGEASKTDPRANSGDRMEFAYERMSLDPEVLAGPSPAAA